MHLKNIKIILPSRLILIFFLLIVFFMGYNRFLVDRSLQMFEFALSDIKQGEVEGLNMLFDLTAKESMSGEGKISSLAAINYIDSTLLRETKARGLNDAEILVKNLIEEKRKDRNVVLKAIDPLSYRVNSFIERTAGFIGALGKRESKGVLADKLDKAFLLHKAGDLKAADELYSQIIRKGHGTMYAYLARQALSFLRKQKSLKEEKKNLIKIVNKLSEARSIQETYYRIGEISMFLFEYNQAKSYFEKCHDTIPDSELAEKSVFKQAIIEKIKGDNEKAKNILNGMLKNNPDTVLRLDIELQIADILRRQKKYKEAAAKYYNLATKFENAKVAPVLLSEANFVYLYDLKDKEKSVELSELLLKKYPASDILKQARDLLVEEKMLPEMEQKKKIFEEIIWRLPVIRKASELMEGLAAWFAINMIEGTAHQAILQHKKRGEAIKIEISPAFLTARVRRHLTGISAGSPARFNTFKITFHPGSIVKCSGIITIGPFSYNFFASGRMSLKGYRARELLNLQGAQNPTKWVSYELTEGKWGPFKIPVAVMNRYIKKAVNVFNQMQIFEIQRLYIDSSVTIFEGRMLLSQSEIQDRIRVLNTYKTRLNLH